MSAFGKHGVRCDWCGKVSNDALGEYTKPDGLIGYIGQASHKRGEGDICEECAAGYCIQCGSNQLIRITPRIPGPTGWGWLCESCGKRWEIFSSEGEA